MSYDKIYDKVSISLPDEQFMTMVLIGNSSLTDEDGRVCKDWNVQWPNHNRPYSIKGVVPWGTLEVLKARAVNHENKIKQECIENGKNYDAKNFGSYTGVYLPGMKMTFGQYKGLYVNATKNAVTVEELRNVYGGGIELSVVGPLFKEANFESKTLYPDTGAELIEMYHQLQTHTNYQAPVYVQMWGKDGIAKMIRRNLRARKVS